MYKTFRGVAKHKIPSKTYSPLSGAHFQFSVGLFHRPAAGGEEARTMGGDSFPASQGLRDSIEAFDFALKMTAMVRQAPQNDRNVDPVA
jgi:hypothetical protein